MIVIILGIQVLNTGSTLIKLLNLWAIGEFRLDDKLQTSTHRVISTYHSTKIREDLAMVFSPTL